MFDNPLLADWTFHLPNYLLAVIMYSLLGRFALGFFCPPDSVNYIYRAFVWLTEPAARLVRVITPVAVPAPLVLIFAVLWLAVIRFALVLLMAPGAPLSVGA